MPLQIMAAALAIAKDIAKNILYFNVQWLKILAVAVAGHR